MFSNRKNCNKNCNICRGRDEGRSHVRTRKQIRKQARARKRMRGSLSTFLVIAMLVVALASALAFAVNADDTVDTADVYTEVAYEAAPEEVAVEEVADDAAVDEVADVTDNPVVDDAADAVEAPAQTAPAVTTATEAEAAYIEIAPLSTVIAGTYTGAEIQVIIDAAASGDTITFEAGVTINGGFQINNGVALQGNGTVINLPSTGSQVVIQANNVTLNGFTINNAATAGVWAPNILVHSSSGVTISNNTINVAAGAYGDNAAVSTGWAANISGLVISGNTINGAGANRALIINAGADGTMISGNTFAGAFNSSLLINVNNAQIVGNTFAESYTVPNGNSMVIWDFGNDSTGSFNTVITGNTFRDGQAVNIVFADENRETNVTARYLLDNNTFIGLEDGYRILSPADSTSGSEDDVRVMVITFDSQGGSAVADFVGLTGDSIGTAWTVPTYDGHTFAGWWTAATGGEEVTAATEFEAGTTLFARWTEAGQPDPLRVVETFPRDDGAVEIPVDTPHLIITFDREVNTAIAGTVTMAWIDVVTGELLGSFAFDVAADGVWSEGNTVLTLSLEGLLVPGAIFSVMIDDFVAADGGEMESWWPLAFVTASDLDTQPDPGNDGEDDEGGAAGTGRDRGNLGQLGDTSNVTLLALLLLAATSSAAFALRKTGKSKA